MNTRFQIAVTISLFALAACHHPVPVAQTPPPAPVPPKPQSLVVLLPEPGGKLSSLSVTNSAGSQTLSEAYQAVRIEGPNAAPSAPFQMDDQEVRRRFGSLLDALPPPEVSFLLYFFQASDNLTAESRAILPQIFAAIRERHSTAISVIGHTDTTGSAQTNYQLGLRRAQAVVEILRQQGGANSDFTVESHGDADLLVKTGPNVDEPRNRRVEVIVR